MGRRWAFLVGLAAIAAAAAVLVPASLAASCDETWTSTSTGGDWNTTTDWSSGTVPTSSQSVCLPAGSYTVTITGEGASAASVTVGAGVTLSVVATQTSGSTLTLNSGTSDNSGTLELTDNATTSSSQRAEVLLDSGSSLTNDGTILSDPGDGFGTRSIDMQDSTSTVNNASDGAITVNYDLQIDGNGSQAGLFETSGNVTIATAEKFLVDPSGASLAATESAEMDINGGTITDNGTFGLGVTETGGIGGSSPLKVNGGTITGAGLMAVAGATSDMAGTGIGASFSGSGSGTYTFIGSLSASATTLGGTIDPNQTVVLSASTADGGVNFQVNANTTNNGTIDLTDSDASGTNTNADTIQINTGDTLTNGGTILSDPGPMGAGQRVINGQSPTGVLDNASGGTITVNQDLQIDAGQSGLFETSGNITIAAGEKLLADPNGGPVGGNPAKSTAEMDINGGTITDNGTFEQGINEAGSRSGASLKVNGGTITGAGLVGVVGEYTDLAGTGIGAEFSGSGSGTYTFIGGSCACTTTLSGTIGAAQTLVLDASTADGGVTVQPGANVTNNGTIELADSDASGTNGNAANLQIGTGDTLTNDGTITSSGAYGTRTISAQGTGSALMNASGATVDIGTTTALSANATNDGTWIQEPGVQLQTSSTFTQGSGGTLVTWVDPGTSSAGEITGATTDLAGTLEVKTLGSVSASSQFTVVSGTVSGTFGSEQFIGPTYTVATSSTSVKLTNVNDTLAVGTTSLPAGNVGEPYSQTLEPSGGTPSYTWAIQSGSLPPGLSLDTSTGVISGTAVGPAGTSNFTVQVTDGNANTASQALSITVNPTGLAVTTALLPQGQIGVGYDQTLAATGGTTPYSWSLSSGSLPAGLSLNTTTGEISGTPSGPSETSIFTVEVTDSSSPAQHAARQLSITIAGTPLQITTTSLPNGQVGSSYDQALAASGGTTPYTWSIKSGSLPAGLSLNASTGEISGTPAGPTGTSSFTVDVTDSSTPIQSTNQPLSITVGPATLRVTTTSLAGGQVDGPYSQTLAASGGTTPYTWSIQSGALPPGLSLDPSTGVISGTPSGPAGTASFTVQVADGHSTATQALSIAVSPSTLQVTTSSLAGGATGSAYSQTLAAAGGTPPYSWSISSGSLPPGLALDAASGAISGTPTSGGSFGFSVTATDSASPAQSATRALSISVSAAPPPQVTTTSLATGAVGTPYGQTLAATSGTPPFTWSISSGSLPAGLSLSASGGIVGTPLGPPGNASFTVKVLDSASQSSTKSLSITIASGNSTGGLDGVSCPSSTSCSAVGYLYSNLTGTDTTLAQSWEGTSWIVQPTVNPPATQMNVLRAVSCLSASSCTAVGYYESGANLTPLAEHWNGTSWSQQRTPASSSPGFNAISCVSSSFCIAVGQTATGPFAEKWNGTRWAVQTLPSPSSAHQGISFSGVSCTSVTSCIAVGSYDTGAGTSTLVETSNGTSWQIQSSPNPGINNVLNAVSCTSPTACTAVGFYFNGHIVNPVYSALAERWNGATWTVQTPGLSGFFNGVSCASSSACTAVGSGSGAVIADAWNGSTWAPQTVPGPAGATSSELDAVSCVAANACTAVGRQTVGGLLTGTTSTLAERWNGSTWSIQVTGNAAVAPTAGGGAVVVAAFPGPGTVTMTVTSAGPARAADAVIARLRALLVARVRKVLHHAGIVRLKIVPSAKAKALINKLGKLPVQINLSFKPRHGPATHFGLRTLLRRRPRHTPGIVRALGIYRR
jgi:hypothetical protein